MLQHIVMLKLKPGEEEEKKKNSKRLKDAIERLEDSIEQILFMQVGENISTRPSAFDLVLVTDFENVAALDIYRDHPKHIEVLDLVREVTDKVHVVDFEF